jgi:hypothetical protein
MFKIKVLVVRALVIVAPEPFYTLKDIYVFNYIFAIVLCYNSEILIYLVGLIDFSLSYEMKN